MSEPTKLQELADEISELFDATTNHSEQIAAILGPVLDAAVQQERQRCWGIAAPGMCCCDPSRAKFIKHFSNCAQYIAAAIEGEVKE